MPGGELIVGGEAALARKIEQELLDELLHRARASLAACRTYGEGRFCSKGFPCSGVAHFDKLLKLLRDTEQDC